MTKEQLKDTVTWLSQEENREALQLVVREIKYLLHHFRPRNLSGAVVFGFEDPYTVGRVLGLLSIFYPVYREQLAVTPVFDRQVLEGDFETKGHIRLIHLVAVLVRLYRNPAIRAELKKRLGDNGR